MLQPPSQQPSFNSTTSMHSTGMSYKKRNNGRLKKLKMGMKYDDPIYPGLCKLKLNGKDLNNPPQELFTLLDLELLDLSPERKASIYYKLRFVPPAISNLINLKVLVLDTNELEEIPAEISLLENLERLCISNNQLRQLPDGFERLKMLKSLHAANNYFTNFHPSICKLKDLQFLDLSDNQIGSLPEDIVNLTNLQTLMLVMNRLRVLPPCICTMTHLRSLWVGSNQIVKLPPQFGQLKNLDWGESHTSSLAVGGNPLVHPPKEVCSRGVEEIDNYFKRLAALEMK